MPARLVPVNGPTPNLPIIHYNDEEDGLILGRSAGCAVQIPDFSVSRQHARIVYRAGQYFLIDLQARNGTYLDKVQVTGEVRLRHRQVVGVGQALLRFERTFACGDWPDVELPAEVATNVEVVRFAHLFRDGELERISILGDALMDANCPEDNPVLLHCGLSHPKCECWVPHLILGEE